MKTKAIYRACFTGIVLIGVVTYAWMRVNRSEGAQVVSFVAASEQCSTAGSLRYCVYKAAAGTNGDVLYHLHGRNLDEHVWNDDTYFTAMIQAQWQSDGAVPPTVVEVSYGPSWLLTPGGKRPASGLLDDFMAHLHEIEKTVGSVRRRLLMGESMGGLNVLIASLSYPKDFAKVAALCPGVYATSPFASWSTIKRSMELTGASLKMIFGIWMLAREFVADDSEWRRISPLALMMSATPDYPALYLSCGLYDAYGNFEGTRLLASEAQQRGVRTEWEPIYGGHCAVDVPSLAKFLLD